MSTFNIEGKLEIESNVHTIEYEPSSMTGAKTLFLRIRNQNHNVPITYYEVDNVIEMLKKGKAMLEALEFDKSAV